MGFRCAIAHRRSQRVLLSTTKSRMHAGRGMKTTPQRSALMRRVRREDTRPEQAVRQILWDLGGRYRKNVPGLPGRPDIANKDRKLAIFVHGCFWHFHEQCERGRIPVRNREFWQEKFAANRSRDLRKKQQLEELGFRVLVVWECELQDRSSLAGRLRSFWFTEAQAPR